MFVDILLYFFYFNVHLPFIFYFLFPLIIFYSLCYYSCSDVSPFSPFHPVPSISFKWYTCRFSCPWVMCVNSSAIPFPVLYLHPHGYSVTAYLYFLIPSPLHLFLHIPLPSGNHHNALHIHDSVSVLLVCSVCFLDTIVDRYIFFAILMFVVLIIFFFLNKSL